jgi:hypothetical protein
VSLILIVFALSHRELHAQTSDGRVPVIAGCYHLARGEWSKPLGANAAYHALPQFVRLDTGSTGHRGRKVTPDIAFPTSRRFPGTPYWSIMGDTIRIVWSNGFQTTGLSLVREGADLRGLATVDGDAHEYGEDLPRASILARRIGCTTISETSQDRVH